MGILRIFGIGLVFVVTSIGWLILGGVTSERSRKQSYQLRDSVSELWGREQTQHAPKLTFRWSSTREVERQETVQGQQKTIRETVVDYHNREVAAASTRARVDLHLDQRLKGLVWYALYDVHFTGRWTYIHQDPTPGELHINFSFPDAQGIYDDFHFVVDGVPITTVPSEGQMTAWVPVLPGKEITLELGYKSRGLDRWSYSPSQQVGQLEDFELQMTTDFAQIDFPAYTMSPSNKTLTAEGWALVWKFNRVVTGHGVGMVMPAKIQPGELAASLAFSAPICLFFFFLVIFALGTLRKIDIHPVNYFFLGGAFFAFHLLFAYSVDHLELVTAFVVASVVSIVLVVSYLRLVVSNRFAFVEAALAQLIYLVGFSLAYFWEGFTGLTVTILSILTLGLLMQLTGRIRWSEVLGRAPVSQPTS